MLNGINVDPENLAAWTSPRELAHMGCRAVRMVSRDLDSCRAYRDQAQEAGLVVLATVAAESQGFILPDCQMYQIGNEPDGHGPSSWTMTRAAYRAEWQIYRDTYPDLYMIAAGLTSGDVSWWAEVGPELEGCAGVAVHPYSKSATVAQKLLKAYKAVRPDLALWVTEWNRPPLQVVPFTRMLRLEAEAAFWFCASDAMVPGFGLLGTPAEQLYAASAY